MPVYGPCRLALPRLTLALAALCLLNSPLPAFAVTVKVRAEAEFRAALAATTETGEDGSQTLVLSLPLGAAGGTIRQCLARNGRQLSQCRSAAIEATSSMRFALDATAASWVDITYF